MQVCVEDCLPGGLAYVDADVVSVRRPARVELLSNRRQKVPHCRLLVGTEGKEIRFVPPGDDQAVTFVQRERISKRCGVLVRCEELSSREPVTEDAGHLTSRTAMASWPTFLLQIIAAHVYTSDALH